MYAGAGYQQATTAQTLWPKVDENFIDFINNSKKKSTLNHDLFKRNKLIPIASANAYLKAGNLHNQALDYIAGQLHASDAPPVDKIASLVLDWYVTQVPQAAPEQKIIFYASTASGMNYAQRYSVEELCTIAKLSGQATSLKSAA